MRQAVWPTATDVLGVVSLIFWALVVGSVAQIRRLSSCAPTTTAKAAFWRCCPWWHPNASRAVPGSPLLVLLGIVGDGAALRRRRDYAGHLCAVGGMEGLKLDHAGLEDAHPAGGRWAILIGLFAIQRRGTAKIGRLFGPVMVTWFVVIGMLGAINTGVAPAILKALNPLEAVGFVATNPVIAFAVMGGVFLALTGAEALYADMGHVGPRAIRSAWFGLVLPALLLNYFGQGALVLTDPAAVDSPFYKLAPHWALIPMVLLAAMAAVIASQALISGFSRLPGRRCRWDFARACGSSLHRATQRARSTCRRPTGC